ncbi:hypothetical protein EA462_05570 [Natrarchaeobius halalkaliphilus]|uniref:Uncharacterized protein n=1 Tax=Natrarchaeobius halalkaliphilus TaxID=1679091 RepID=A0A3N6LSB9_9EURY|nr:hypothetical protein [Natrarchaeobius halalkaliphilus]RQG91437.1 hypothetical protein EA462_05570 [Natrarchaeobius halalkaliphilus]
MDIPTDRLLVMLIVASGLAVLMGGWAGGLVQAETTGWEGIGLRVAIGVVFFAALLGAWIRFSRIDEEKG